MFLVSSFVGSFLPAGIGGDAARAWSLAQITSRAGEALASVMVDRLLGVLSLAAMGVAGVLAWTPAAAAIGRVVLGRRRAVRGLRRRVLGRCGDPRGGARPRGIPAR